MTPSRAHLLALTLTTAAASPLAEANAPAAPFEAVRSCAVLTEVRQEIPLNSGVYTEKAQVAVPNRVTVRLYLDESAFADCLDRRGVDGDISHGAYFARLEACRSNRPELQARIGTGAPPRLLGSGGPEALSDCLRQGPEVEVEFPTP